jgi:hypothetical protein
MYALPAPRTTNKITVPTATPLLRADLDGARPSLPDKEWLRLSYQFI